MHLGNFSLSKEGGWIGFIHTLTMNGKIRLVPNDDGASDNAPDFRVLLGNSRIGEAWNARTAGDSKNFLRVRIDDPLLKEPIFAALFPSETGNSADLVWNRKREG